MGTLTSCSNFSTLNLRTAINGAVSITTRKRGRLFKSQFGLNYKNCYLCQKGLKKEFLGIEKNVKLFNGLVCFSSNDDDNDSKSSGLGKDSSLATKEKVVEESEESSSSSIELGTQNEESDSFPSSSGTPPNSPVGMSYNNFQVDSFKLMELLGPEKVVPADVKLIKDKLFGYSTFWVIKEEPFGDFGEGILFLGNLRSVREDVFEKLQKQLAELVGDKYNLFMVEEPNSESPDPRGGPQISFGM